MYYTGLLPRPEESADLEIVITDGIAKYATMDGQMQVASYLLPN